MIIALKKFGIVLTSREAGREAYAAFRPSLAGLPDHEEVVLDFEGVHAVSPSWADEFMTPLKETYGGRMRLKRSDNPSVKATVALLEKIHGYKFESD